MKIIGLFSLLWLMYSPLVFAANITAIQDGSWMTAAIWDLGRTPQDNDVVFIPAGRLVFFSGAPYPKNTPAVRPTLTINIYGTLDFSNAGNDKLYLDAGSRIQIYSGGKIQTSASSSEIIAIFDGTNDNTVWIGTPSTISGPAYATATTIGFVNGILPVKLQSFVISKEKTGYAKLTWKTITEINTARFEIETLNASTSNWKYSGQVNATGNSTSAIEYNYIVQLVRGENQFKLKQLDNDGKFTYSPVVSIRFNSENPVAVVYNQNTHQLIVNNPETNPVSISISDISGHILYKGNFTSPINFNPKVTGMYLVNIITPAAHTARKIMVY